MQIRRVDFIALPVEDLARADAFYGETVGLVRNPQTSGDRWVEYETGNLTLALSTFGGALALGVSDVDEARSELEEHGIGVSAFCPGPVQTNIREGGRMRPARYADSGYTELERDLENRPNSPLWMDPVEVGERVLAGIRRNDLYIFTHREFREGAEERFRAMLASFPDEPLDEERADGIRFLLSNPIFREVQDRS